MRKQKFGVAVQLILLVSLTMSPSALSQARVNAGQQRRLQNFRSKSWKIRSQAFNGIVAEGLTTDNVKVGVMELLATENAFVRSRQTLAEAYFDYYIDVISQVADLNDSRSLDALLGSMTTGHIATRGIARLGRVALTPVIVRLDNGNVHVRQAAAVVLSEMLERVPDDGVARKEIRSALFKAASDEYPYVRISAIEGIAKIGDAEALALLHKIAVEDTYDASVHGGDRGVYPVREAARSLLLEVDPRN